MNDPRHLPPTAPAALCTDRAPSERTRPGGLLDSADLLQGGKSVTICHKGEFYRLQSTRQGKLILTK